MGCAGSHARSVLDHGVSLARSFVCPDEHIAEKLDLSKFVYPERPFNVRRFRHVYERLEIRNVDHDEEGLLERIERRFCLCVRPLSLGSERRLSERTACRFKIVKVLKSMPARRPRQIDE